MLMTDERLDMLREGVVILKGAPNYRHGRSAGQWQTLGQYELAEARFADACRGLDPGHQLWELSQDLQGLARDLAAASKGEE